MKLFFNEIKINNNYLNKINLKMLDLEHHEIDRAIWNENIDFSEEQLNKYTINPNAIIVNIQNNVRIKAKRFNGIIINDIKPGVPLNYKMKFARANIYYDFEEKELYESSIYYMDFEVAQKKIAKDNIYIEAIIGNNGPINTKEFEEKCKFCVKTIDKNNILN